MGIFEIIMIVIASLIFIVNSIGVIIARPDRFNYSKYMDCSTLTPKPNIKPKGRPIKPIPSGVRIIKENGKVIQ